MSIGQRSPPVVRGEPSVTTEDDGGGRCSSVHRGGDDEIGGETLADAAGIEGDRRADLHDGRLGVDRHVVEPRTPLAHDATRRA